MECPMRRQGSRLATSFARLSANSGRLTQKGTPRTAQCPQWPLGGHFSPRAKRQLGLLQSRFYSTNDRFGDRVQSQIDRPAVPIRRAQDLDLAADTPV